MLSQVLWAWRTVCVMERRHRNGHGRAQRLSPKESSVYTRVYEESKGSDECLRQPDSENQFAACGLASENQQHAV
jgi:hypothetical protein